MRNQNKPLIVGAEDLGGPIGSTALCPICGKYHTIEYGTDAKTGEVSKMLGFVSCGGKSYLVAIEGKELL